MIVYVVYVSFGQLLHIVINYGKESTKYDKTDIMHKW